MPDSKYKALFRSKIKGAISQALAAKVNIEHPGVKGDMVEGLIRDLFQPLLPPDIGIGTGHIIENYQKRCSKQQDIILYDKSILPPVLYQHDLGLFPIESVLYTIEVKTTLTAYELMKAHESAKEINSFSLLPGLKDANGKEMHHKVEKPRSVVFALSSDLRGNGKSEAKRYRELYHDDYPFIRAICVAGKEYWYESNGCWIIPDMEDEYDEILGFIGGVMNTYNSVAESRGKPNLGHYIIDTPLNSKGLSFIPSGTMNILNLHCEKCGKKAVQYRGLQTTHLNEKGKISSDDNCHSCGGTLSAPGGSYEAINGEYIRMGDYKQPDGE